MRPTFSLCAAWIALAAFSAAADVIHFVNGDRLTGTLVDAEANTVAIDVPHIGVVVAPESQVANVIRDDATAAPQPAPAAQPPQSAAAPARRFSEWDLRSDFGIAITSGNTRTQDFDFIVGAERSGERFDNVVGISRHQAKARAEAGGPTTSTKNQFDINYDLRWKYKDTWYAVANFEFFRDPIKDINQRITAGLGLGHLFWESERGALHSDIGVSQVFEELDIDSGVDKSQDPALRWSVDFKRWLVAERLEAFHNSQWLYILASDSNSVWDSGTGLRLHLGNSWHAGLRMGLQHETRPAANRRKTDVSYALTFGVTL